MGLVLFREPSKVPTDRRVINAILRRAQKKYESIHGKLPKGVRMETSQFGYIEVIQYDENGWGRYYTDAHNMELFHDVEYKGRTYHSGFEDGCFSPYVVAD